MCSSTKFALRKTTRHCGGDQHPLPGVNAKKNHSLDKRNQMTIRGESGRSTCCQGNRLQLNKAKEEKEKRNKKKGLSLSNVGEGQ